MWPTAADAVGAARADGYLVVGSRAGRRRRAPARAGAAESDAEVCLAVGHEDHGLSAASLAGCDAVAFLPQLGRVGSLNVATAAAIALYEIRRREWASSSG